MSKQREPCGCVHDGRQWLAMCHTHQAESDALHKRAQREHALDMALLFPDYQERHQ